MKKNTIISTLIACFTLIGLQVKTDAQDDVCYRDPNGLYYGSGSPIAPANNSPISPAPPSPNYPVGAVISDIITKSDLDNTQKEVMTTLINSKIGEVSITNWTQGNGFEGFKYDGNYNFRIEIGATGSFSITQTGAVDVLIASGQLSTKAQLELSGKITIETNLSWEVVAPLQDDKKTVNKDANLLVKFQYTYKGVTYKGQVRIPVTLNDIEAAAKARADSATSGVGGGSSGGGGGSSSGGGFSVMPGVFLVLPAFVWVRTEKQLREEGL